MKIIAEATDWDHDSDANRAAGELLAWVDGLSPEDHAQLAAELASDAADWNVGMMAKVVDKADEILEKIFSDYAMCPQSGHSLNVRLL